MSRTYHHGHKAKYKKFGDLWRWYKQEPKWWRKIAKHKKRRSATRQALHKVYKGVSKDEVEFPLDIKPWIYYW